MIAMPVLRIVVSLLLLFVASGAYAEVRDPEPLSNFPQTSVEIATPDARVHRFTAWVADTDAHREQGLMFVKQLPEDHGMLFIFPKSARVAFWMKNTFIPLDMIFIRADGHVDSVGTNAKPQSLDLIASDGEVLKVLEINAGLAQKLGVRPGALVSVRE